MIVFPNKLESGTSDQSNRSTPPNEHSLYDFRRIHLCRNQNGPDPGEGHQNKCPAEHPRVGQDEVFFADRDLVAVKQVEVGGSGSVGLVSSRLLIPKFP
jgi:hypothetical protein